jgi:hypothetical protein
MLTRFIAVAGLAALSCGVANAGTIANGAWAPSTCGSDPGPRPEFNTKNADGFNKSVKDATAWQEKSKTFTECMVNEGKADQNAIVATMNKQIEGFNTASRTMADESNAALAKLNKGGAASPKKGSALGAAAGHDR